MAIFVEWDLVHVWTISTLSGCWMNWRRHDEAGLRWRAPGIRPFLRCRRRYDFIDQRRRLGGMPTGPVQERVADRSGSSGCGRCGRRRNHWRLPGLRSVPVSLAVSAPALQCWGPESLFFRTVVECSSQCWRPLGSRMCSGITILPVLASQRRPCSGQVMTPFWSGVMPVRSVPRWGQMAPLMSVRSA